MYAAGEDRAHDLRIMRPTRYQLRYCRSWSAHLRHVLKLRRFLTEADQGWAAPSLADPTPTMGALGIIRLGKAPVTLHLRGSKQRHHNRGPQGGAGICMRQVRIELTTLGL